MKTFFLFCLCSAVLAVSACNDDSSSTPDSDTKVFKYSGKLQCQDDSGTALTEMQAELSNEGIDTLCAQTGNDGASYPEVCGGRTGDINIYQIRNVNIEDAEELGFYSVVTLPQYSDQECTPP